MAASNDSSLDVPIADLIETTVTQLEEEVNHVLTPDQINALLETTTFMRTSSKSMTGVFVDSDKRVQVVHVLGQMSEDFELMGTLKYKQASEVLLFAFFNHR